MGCTHHTLGLLSTHFSGCLNSAPTGKRHAGGVSAACYPSLCRSALTLKDAKALPNLRRNSKAWGRTTGCELLATPDVMVQAVGDTGFNLLQCGVEARHASLRKSGAADCIFVDLGNIWSSAALEGMLGSGNR
jgi:hypothetical protein